MPAATNAFEAAILDHYFLNSAIPNVGDATGLPAAGTVGSLYASLHTADPGEGGSQNTNECAYGGYARLAIARSGSGFSRTNNVISNVAIMAWPQATSGSEVARWIGFGRSLSGAGTLDFRFPLRPTRYKFTFDVGVDAGTDKIVAPGHNFAITTGLNEVYFEADSSGSLPTGISAGTIYYVKTATTDSFTISATDGGSTLNITASGSGFVQGTLPLPISSGITPQIAIGGFTIACD